MIGGRHGPMDQGIQGESGPGTVVPNDMLSAQNNVNSYVCLQTGEEFSSEFLRDRLASKINLSRSPMAHNQETRTVFSNDPSQLGYEDLARILGLSKINSGCGSDYSEFVSARGFPFEVDNWARDEETRACPTDDSDSLYGHRRAISEMNFDRAVALGSRVPPITIPHSPHSCGPYESGFSDGLQSCRMRILCSFGGRILPRPSDGKLRYVGGETRIISIQKNISWGELLNKTTGICNHSHTIKYQLPGEDLDALISVSSDEDLQNMMEEYHGLERQAGSQRLRIFLIPTNESDNRCSLETSTIQQRNPDFEYVVAVNGILDPSPRREQLSIGGVNKSGGNFDCNPSFHGDSPSSVHWFEMKDGPSSSLTQVSKEFPPSTMSPIQSPSFSPRPVHQGNTKNNIMQWYEEKSCRDSSESNSSTVAAQQPFVHSFVKPNPQSGKLHFHSRQPSRELVPSVINHNQSDGCSIAMLMPEGSSMYSGKCMSQIEERGDILGSVGSNGSHNGMIHALSDSQLQQYGERSSLCSQDVVSPPSPLSFAKPVISTPAISAPTLEEVMQAQDNDSAKPLISTAGVSAPSQDNLMQGQGNIDVKLVDMDSTMPSTNVDLLNPPCSEPFGHNQHMESSSNAVDEKCQTWKEGLHEPHPMMQTSYDVSPVSLERMNGIVNPSSCFYWGMLNQNRSPPTSMEYKLQHTNCYQFSTGSQEPQLAQCLASEHTTVESQTQHPLMSFNIAWYQQCDLNGIRNGQQGNNLSQCISSETTVAPPSSTLLSYDGYSQTEPPSGFSSDPNLPVSTGQLPVACHRDQTPQEPFLISSTNLYPPAVCDDDSSSSHLQQDDVSPFSQFSNKEALYRRKASPHADQLLDHPEEKIENIKDQFVHEKSAEDSSQSPSESLNAQSNQKQQEPFFVVEDVTSCTFTGVDASSAIDPHAMEVPSKGLLLPNEIEGDGIYKEIDSQEFEADRDDPINDAVIAEIEAGIYGLQIIKNADLEELRELGSGTYGTVYHGKWRGTDVAIKRIKKSCFSGRSSEQDRLTKDFWREAQILSKLHHPNVVAFYGVVPDGAGGTLATVAEFMVNGSLRNALIKKDRSLDRRKKLMIAMDAAFGMEYLHSKNIVHFDLKCDNLLVNLRDPQRPICKVGDFGLSRIKRNTLVSGGVRGTLPWMAPELLNGSSSKVSEKVDVFSFGIAMWEMLTGDEPYANMHCGAIIGGILKDTLRPSIPDNCDSEWRKLMEQCWSSDPDGRPSFTEIADRLRSMSAAVQARGHRYQRSFG
ncbi:hypothetical protein Ancab_019832 [Ancistrocladus abbreviatus]